MESRLRRLLVFWLLPSRRRRRTRRESEDWMLDCRMNTNSDGILEPPTSNQDDWNYHHAYQVAKFSIRKPLRAKHLIQ